MSVRWNTLDGDTAQDNADYRRDQENAAREDARNHWGGFDPMDDGRDETPDPPGDWPDDDALMRRFRETGARMRAEAVRGR